MTLRGIDVSRWQGDINWNTVKNAEKIDFAILQAGYGRDISQKDPTFEKNYKGCKDNNIPVGAYWYSYATTVEDAIREANTCLEAIKGKQFEYPIYFDVEESRQFALGKTAVSNIIKAFLDTVEKAGYWVGLYMSTSYLLNYVTEDIRKRYAIWCAEYASKCSYGGQYAMWQYSVAGHGEWDLVNKKYVAGVQGQCDLDYCYTDYPTAIKNAGLNGFKKAETPKVNTPSPKAEVKKKTIEVELKHEGVTYAGTLTEK